MVYLILYVFLAFVVIFSTNKVSNYIDDLDKQTNLSGAVVGGVFLATITSLPEFITSITSTVSLHQPGLAFGNVFGSNMFNIVILAVADLFFLKHFFFINVKEGRNTNRFVMLMYIIFLIPMFFGSFTTFDYDLLGINIFIIINVISIIIIIIYVLSIKSMSNIEEIKTEEELEHVATYSVKQLIVLIIVWAIFVVLASYYITVVTDYIAQWLDIGSSFAGAIFLGVATSLPELTAVFTLVKLKNHDAAMGNIVGSNIFNMMIISVADILNKNENLFNVLSTDLVLRENINLLLILGLINSIILTFALSRNNVKNKIVYIIPSILIIVNYLIYLGLSV